MKINFIALEANEGVGKTTLSKSLAQKLGAKYTYEPNGETSDLKTLRTMALHKDSKINTYGRELIMLANRSIHLDYNVKPLLLENNTVITDRCFLSGMVYANYQGIMFNEWFDLCLKSKIDLFPQLIIFMTVNKRKIIKKKGDIYDHAGEENLKKIDDIFEKAIEFISERTDCIFIRYKNNLNRSIEKNVNNLVYLLQRYGVNLSAGRKN